MIEYNITYSCGVTLGNHIIMSTFELDKDTLRYLVMRSLSLKLNGVNIIDISRKGENKSEEKIS